jgi:hypothetical protein
LVAGKSLEKVGVFTTKSPRLQGTPRLKEELHGYTRITIRTIPILLASFLSHEIPDRLIGFARKARL